MSPKMSGWGSGAAWMVWLVLELGRCETWANWMYLDGAGEGKNSDVGELHDGRGCGVWV
jgi:hypothetical protein